MFNRLPAQLISIFLQLVPTAVFACDHNDPISWRIAELSADTIILAQVERATYSGEKGDYNDAWDGSAVLKRVLKGQTDTKVFSIGRTGQSAMCDDGISIPKPTDLWVIYLKGKLEYQQEAYPLAVAREADPSLNKFLLPDDAK